MAKRQQEKRVTKQSDDDRARRDHLNATSSEDFLKRKRLTWKIFLWICGGMLLIAVVAGVIVPWLGWGGGFVFSVGLLAVVAFGIAVVSLVIAWRGYMASSLAELYSKDSFELARKTAHSHVYFYAEDFREHLLHLSRNLDPEKFKNTPFVLRLALSTPAYGVGVLKREMLHRDYAGEYEKTSLSAYLDWLERWVDLCGEEHERTETPTVEITMWDPVDARRISFLPSFDEGDSEDEKRKVLAAQKSAMAELAKLLGELYKHADAKKIKLSVRYSKVNDVRIFLANHGETCAGMMVFFSPLSNAKIEHWDWKLAGCSIYDSSGFGMLRDFFNCFDLRETAEERAKLGRKPVLPEPGGSHKPEVTALPVDVTDELSNPRQFLERWFGEPLFKRLPRVSDAAASNVEGKNKSVSSKKKDQGN